MREGAEGQAYGLKGTVMVIPKQTGTQSSSGTGPDLKADTPSRLLRLPEVMERVGLRRAAIYQRMSEGRFPKCRSLGPKCSVWVESEINAWIDTVIQSRNHTDR
jgi:prophage regulatory protein